MNLGSLRRTTFHRLFLHYCVLLLATLSISGCSLFKKGAPKEEGFYKFERYQPGSIPEPPPEPLPPPALILNREVQRELNAMVRHEGLFIRQALERRERYFPVIAQIFYDEGIPLEMMNLAFIESGYNLDARSGVGAVGMWQFMKPTATLYGLSVTRTHDERRDLVLSSLAAARYLRELYSIFHDWYLALAAYNAGPGAVGRSLKKYGATDFWSLARRGKLTKQTREFVPRFIAAALIARDPMKYGITGISSTQEILQGIHLQRKLGSMPPSVEVEEGGSVLTK